MMRAWPLTLLFSIACSSEMALGGRDDVDGDYDTAGSPEPGGGDGATDDSDEAEAPEDDRLNLRPAETDVFIFVANPENDSVTRVNVNTLEVRTTPVGVRPTAVAVTPDWATAVVFNQGDATVTLLDADTLSTVVTSVRPNLNRLVLSPDGRYAILWHDVNARRADDPRPGGAVSYNELSLVDVQTGDHYPVVAGFNPKSVRFSRDGSLALAVADASLATIDLSGAAPDVRFLPIADPLDPPVAAEVEIAPSGTWAFIRQLDTTELTVVDLLSGAVDAVPVGANTTDLDLTPDGAGTVVVSRDAAEVAVFQTEDPFADPERLSIPLAEPLGSVLVGPGNSAILYTTSGLSSRYATWDLASGDIRLRPLPKPARSIARTPEGSSLLVIHDPDDNDDGSTPLPYRGKDALSLIDLDDQRINTLALQAPVSGYANSSNGRYGYVILEGRSFFEVLDYRTLITEELPLRSQAVYVGVLPDLDPGDGDEPPAWVSQAHDLGRISFYDPDDASSRTITGFELNGQIED